MNFSENESQGPTKRPLSSLDQGTEIKKLPEQSRILPETDSYEIKKESSNNSPDLVDTEKAFVISDSKSSTDHISDEDIHAVIKKLMKREDFHWHLKVSELLNLFVQEGQWKLSEVERHKDGIITIGNIYYKKYMADTAPPKLSILGDVPTKSEFFNNVDVFEAEFLGNKVRMEPRLFKQGTCGFINTTRKMSLKLKNGSEVKCSLNVQIYADKSKSWTEGSLTDEYKSQNE